jgi:hypothetical protein
MYVKAVDEFTSVARSLDKHISRKRAFQRYAQHVLKNGSEFEITRLIRNLDVSPLIKSRKIVVA